MKIMGQPPGVNPIEKHVNSIFNGKSVVIFFQGPPYKGQKF